MILDVLNQNQEDHRVSQNFRVLIYRITITTPEGTIAEFNPKEVKEWAESKGLESVKILYEGLAQDLYPDLSPGYISQRI